MSIYKYTNKSKVTPTGRTYSALKTIDAIAVLSGALVVDGIRLFLNNLPSFRQWFSRIELFINMVDGSRTREDNAVPSSWLENPVVKNKKIAVVQLKNGEKKSVTLKQLYETVLSENERLGMNRGGAEKQMLSEHQEQGLELQRVGQGQLDIVGKKGGFPGKMFSFLLNGWQDGSDVEYGVYCRADKVHDTLGKRWKGRDPKMVVSSGRFQYDVLRRCHTLDMHAMFVLLEPIPLRVLQPVMKDALEKRVEKLSRSEDDTGKAKEDIDHFVHLFDEKRIKGCDWVEGASMKKGTHIVLASTPKAGLVVEAISPGPIARRRTTLLGMNRNPLITASVFDCLIGQDAIDRDGGMRCLDGLIWCANGLKTDTRTNPHTFVSEIDFEGNELLGPFDRVEAVSLQSTSAFSVDREHKPKNFLKQFMRA